MRKRFAKGHDTCVILGAGPAGLTCACELLKQTNIKPIIFEENKIVGGLSKTIEFNGNLLDIGGHRFFSKSKKILDWWFNILPLNNDSKKQKDVMLKCKRLSKVYFDGKFFDYPLNFFPDITCGLKVEKILKIACSYLNSKLRPLKEKTLEDFFINRFGKELYNIFFKDYTEKVWGLKACDIIPDWGIQRIKGLSLRKALFDSINVFGRKNFKGEMSLIKYFYYPEFGAGHIWVKAADKINSEGGRIVLDAKVTQIDFEKNRIIKIKGSYANTGEQFECQGDFFVSSVPVQCLINALRPEVPKEISKAANDLQYRDLIIVGVLLKGTKAGGCNPIFGKSNWLYIQDKKAKVARVQIVNNWSISMLKERNNLLLGLEYFCNKGDNLWSMDDNALASFACGEISDLGFIKKEDVIDTIIVRIEKAYPVYSQSYKKFNLIRNYVDNFENLFLVGRNGMHRYNNMDHSMITAFEAVDCIKQSKKDKSSIWDVNTEGKYIEQC